MLKSLESMIGAAVIAAGIYGAMNYKPPPSDPIDLSFQAEDGSKVDLGALRGKVVLLDFWATWCPPCRDEVPNVVAAYNKYHSQGFEVVGISLDQDKEALDQFTTDNGMTWPQYFDGNGWGNSLAQHFSIHSIPQMWLLDRKGRIITKDARNNLDGQVAELLREPAVQ